LDKGVSNILFVEGVVVHFERAGWDNYMVRMQVNAKGSVVKFNVVRAVAEGENERSVLDHLAKARWCQRILSATYSAAS
jgi:DNA-directed RNA polymerase subunit N (RpoN/RPB10)